MEGEDKMFSTSKTSKIFVGGISWDTTDSGFTSYFSRYGAIKDAIIMRDKTTGVSRGFGFVIFEDPSSVDKVLSQGDLTLDGRKIDCKIAVPKSDIGTAPGTHRTRKIFVGGIPPQTTSDDLRSHFGHFGTVVNAVIMMDRATNRSRGFGFVTFESEDTVDTILARTHQFSSKTVEVKKAVPKGKIEEVVGRGRGGFVGYDGYPYPPPGPYGYMYPPPPYGYPPFGPRGPPRFPFPPPNFGRGRGVDPYLAQRGLKDRSFHPYR
jgi:heterogeneous nuclear ribonucleoprotein A1/A3